MTSSTPIVPVYRALIIVGDVLSKDEMGDLHHEIVTDTTLAEPVEIVYLIRGK